VVCTLNLNTGNFRVAVKAFIINNNKILLIKRRSGDAHKPDQWDIPGGRLELGEDPYEGLKREVREEVNLGIEILLPLDVHHFVRDDKQNITMIIFLCKVQLNTVKLSEEHTEYLWKNIYSAKDFFPSWLAKVIDNYLNYGLDKINTVSHKNK